MEKSTLLSQKLAGYTAFAAALTGFASSADAQIVHVDNPDVIIGLNGSQNFDLDGDGNDDVKFLQLYSSISSASNIINVQSVRSDVFILANGFAAQLLNYDDVIQANNSYFNHPYDLGNFANQSEKFVGVKFSEGTNNYIGWIRISVPGDKTSITVLDWAYTPYTDPTASIKAGQTAGVPTSIKPEVVASLLNVSVSPTKVLDKVAINTQDVANYQITNMEGRVVTQGDLVAGENSIDGSFLANGIYLVKVSNANGSAVKRIVKE